VGAGAFVSELFGEEGQTLRDRGGDKGENGATTGRPRRVGWLDLVASRYGCMAQGTTAVALTLIDVLGYLDEIPVCVGYEADGKAIDHFPCTTVLDRCRPVYEILPGWKCDIRGITDYDALPANAKNYISFVEKGLVPDPLHFHRTQPQPYHLPLIVWNINTEDPVRLRTGALFAQRKSMAALPRLCRGISAVKP
jgi:adenylosuccinate synthase